MRLDAAETALAERLVIDTAHDIADEVAQTARQLLRPREADRLVAGQREPRVLYGPRLIVRLTWSVHEPLRALGRTFSTRQVINRAMRRLGGEADESRG